MPRFAIAPSRTSIRIPKNPHITVALAAEELRRYVQQMTGVQLPVVEDAVLRECGALRGPADAPAGTPAPPKKQSFTIVPATAQVTLQAGSPRALLNAVYALLAQCGCRWSLHGPHAEVVPRLDAAVELT